MSDQSTLNGLETHIAILKHVADGISAGAIIGSLVGFLPHFAAALGVFWYCVQIYDRFWRKKQ